MKCVICGKEIERSSYSNAGLCSDECYKKHYWLERVNNINSPTQVIVKGRVYQIEPEDSISSFRGYDGNLFCIRFFDGGVVKTTNLWLNGDIPEEFRDRLKDNAEFITYDEYIKLIEGNKNV